MKRPGTSNTSCSHSIKICLVLFYHHWYPAGTWEAPNSEYDFDYEKGFKLYDEDYRCDVIDCEADDARYDKDEWRMNIKCFPMLVYKEELVGYKDSEGKKHYFKDEWRKLNERSY